MQSNNYKLTTKNISMHCLSFSWSAVKPKIICFQGLQISLRLFNSSVQGFSVFFFNYSFTKALLTLSP